nr:hypothetical protein [uncultured Anaerostipes sp.]
MWFYRIEVDKRNRDIHITWNTKMTYFKSILGIIGAGACLFNIVWLAGLCLAVLAAALVYYLNRYGELVRLLHFHEKEKKLTYRGSRYSFKDPLIVKIPKVRSI